jgi:protein gp37
MQKSSISWTQYTSNPIAAVHRETGQRGWACSKASPACAYCYSEATNHRWGTGLPFTDRANEAVDWIFIDKEIAALLKRRKPALIFMVDMTDICHPRVPDAWIDRICAVAWLRDQLTLQLLTKYPERLCRYMKGADWGETANLLTNQYLRRLDGPLFLMGEAVPPLPNLHLGATVENQRMADQRLPWLLDTPAMVRYLSVELMLEALDLRPYLATGGISYVIIGRESGANRRPML